MPLIRALPTRGKSFVRAWSGSRPPRPTGRPAVVCDIMETGVYPSHGWRTVLRGRVATAASWVEAFLGRGAVSQHLPLWSGMAVVSRSVRVERRRASATA